MGEILNYKGSEIRFSGKSEKVMTHMWHTRQNLLQITENQSYVTVSAYVTFLGIRLSRGIPLSIMLVCTSGPQRSGMFRWSWCRVLYNWRERWTRPLEHASPIAQFML